MRSKYRYFATKAAHAAFFNGGGDWGGADLYNTKTGYQMDHPQGKDVICKPYYIPDIQPYQSPINDKWITTRSERRYDLESNDCYELPPETRPKGFMNPFFAKKHGVLLAEEYTKTGDARPEVELREAYDVDPDTVVNRAAENRIKELEHTRMDRVQCLYDEKDKDNFTRKGWEKVKEVERLTGDRRTDLNLND